MVLKAIIPVYLRSENFLHDFLRIYNVTSRKITGTGILKNIGLKTIRHIFLKTPVPVIFLHVTF